MILFQSQFLTYTTSIPLQVPQTFQIEAELLALSLFDNGFARVFTSSKS